MKRLLKGFLLLCAAAALTACGAKPEAASSVATVLPESASSSAVTAPAPEHSVQLPESSTAGASDIHTGMDADIDLTLLSDTVVNAEVYNMLVTPENYTDKIVRMTGEYQEYTDEQTGELYHPASSTMRLLLPAGSGVRADRWRLPGRRHNHYRSGAV